MGLLNIVKQLLEAGSTAKLTSEQISESLKRAIGAV